MNPVTGEYEYNDKIIPRVTDILPPLKFYCTPEQLESARQEGIENHSKIEKYLKEGKGKKDPYVKTFQKFINESPSLGPLILCERPLLSIKHLFAGTPDLFYENANIDVKRSIYNIKYHALQLAAYNILRKEQGMGSVKPWYVLTIDAEKETYKVKNVYNAQAESVFLSLLMKKKIDEQINNYLKR